MPLYEFRCASCGATRDVKASFSEADTLVLVCTECGDAMSRVFSTGASVAVLVSGAKEQGQLGGANRRRGRAHQCNDGAVKLTRPNPFRNELSHAPEKQNGT